CPGGMGYFVLFMASILLVWGMGKTISENDRWHHYLKGKAREKRQSKKTNPLLLNDFGKVGLSAV
ncbi:hypothetical protein ACLQ95_09250, partial [Gallibacterium anatis]|uniref:hypothetical protein n=1 Tax=Gallibacterium anatis TaxID=750 RepID=UPI0039FC740B